MDSLFLFCAAAGGVVLVAQMALALLGLGDAHGGLDHHASGESDHSGAWWWSMLSVRALTAGVTFFGIGGLIALKADIASDRAFLVGFAAGGAAMYAVNALMNFMLGFQADHTISLTETVGQSAQVYLRIPEARHGRGKVTLAVRNRTLELDAVTDHRNPLPTGSTVVVLAVEPGDSVLVGPANIDLLSTQETLTHV